MSHPTCRAGIGVGCGSFIRVACNTSGARWWHQWRLLVTPVAPLVAPVALAGGTSGASTQLSYLAPHCGEMMNHLPTC